MFEILTILKPDAVLRRSIGASILDIFQRDERIEIGSFQKCLLPEAVAARHYEHLAGRDFYPWLLRYMTFTEVYVMLLPGDSATIVYLRDILGHTMVHRAEKGTIRNRYGIYAGLNCVHISDSQESAQREVALWKDNVGIRSSVFEMDVQDYVTAFKDMPDHSGELQKVGLELADVGASSERQARLRELMGLECVDVPSNLVDTLAGIVIEGIVSS